ncbi:hypothetical protein ABJI51_22340 [Amycolatopsis sp. NEAU-NG30]|uniref:Uncharacterized protein n=1 Tax=Amycolatopsis melonis TaxID=3156488 RepID=A0ABV0LI39_9PSEU
MARTCRGSSPTGTWRPGCGSSWRLGVFVAAQAAGLMRVIRESDLA